MDLNTTLIAAGFALGALIFFGWRGAKPPDLLRGPRLIPHRMLMLLSAGALLVLLVHLANLVGIRTGRN
jgi:hypothetical protein